VPGRNRLGPLRGKGELRRRRGLLTGLGPGRDHRHDLGERIVGSRRGWVGLLRIGARGHAARSYRWDARARDHHMCPDPVDPGGTVGKCGEPSPRQRDGRRPDVPRGIDHRPSTGERDQ